MTTRLLGLELLKAERLEPRPEEAALPEEVGAARALVLEQLSRRHLLDVDPIKLDLLLDGELPN